MKKRIVLKTFIPAVLLIVVLAALAFVSVYALLLKSSMAESYSEISSPTPASDTPAPLRTAVPVTPSPEPTESPTPSPTPTPTPAPTPDETSLAYNVVNLHGDPTPTPTPTSAPTFTPYFTPDPDDMTFEED